MSDIIKHIYRMTHIENIPHILQYGITHHHSPNANSHYRSIGDRSLIDFRANKEINIGSECIVLGDYIPFYFGIRMPMLYVIQHGGNCVPQATKAEEIVYVVVSLAQIIEDEKITYYFTDGHATDSFTNFYTRQDISHLQEKLDIQAITSRIWSGENIDRDLKRRKQAEFLVKNDIPPEYIIGYVCYNQSSKERMINWKIPENIIKVFPQAYY